MQEKDWAPGSLGQEQRGALESQSPCPHLTLPTPPGEKEEN